MYILLCREIVDGAYVVSFDLITDDVERLNNYGDLENCIMYSIGCRYYFTVLHPKEVITSCISCSESAKKIVNKIRYEQK
jgi:hypothetical protein